MIHDECLEKFAASLYSAYLPYHNFQHISDVLKAGDIILFECKKNGIDFNEPVIYHAILFHDAGYQENHETNGYESKESYSASLAENILINEDYPETHISQVKQAIMSTQMHAQCVSIEDKVVRAADLYGLTAAYPDFREKTVTLYHERLMLGDVNISWDEYKKEACSIINHFLKHKINLDIDLYRGERDKFSQAAYRNLDLLMGEQEQVIDDHSSYSFT